MVGRILYGMKFSKARISILLLSFVTLCASIYFYSLQRCALRKTMDECQELQMKLKAAKNDARFLREHHDQLTYLKNKGWLLPQNRLVGGEKLQQLALSLKAIHLRIEPEITQEIEGHTFRMSKLIIDVEAHLDSHVYDFVDHCLQDFSGVLVLRKLVLSRDRELPVVTGEIIFEWYTMGGVDRED